MVMYTFELINDAKQMIRSSNFYQHMYACLSCACRLSWQLGKRRVHTRRRRSLWFRKERSCWERSYFRVPVRTMPPPRWWSTVSSRLFPAARPSPKVNGSLSGSCTVLSSSAAEPSTARARRRPGPLKLPAGRRNTAGSCPRSVLHLSSYQYHPL